MNVVVTGGATIAPIDDVRIMTNVSSGRFAAAITEACLRSRGAGSGTFMPDRPSFRSCELHGSISTRPSPPPSCERLERLRERWLAARDRLRLVPLEPGMWPIMPRRSSKSSNHNPIDVVILPMAVGDFEPEPRSGKINSELRVARDSTAARTPKVIRLVRDWAPSVYLVGFKLLSRVPDDELIRRAPRPPVATNRAD